MPCYEPPRDPKEEQARRTLQFSQREDKYIATLKDIEATCRDPQWHKDTGDRLAQLILGIIDAEWGEKK